MLILVSSVSHNAVKYARLRGGLIAFRKACLLTYFSRGKDGLASSVCPQPHLALLAADDTFARLCIGPGQKHVTQVEVLAILIVDRK